MKETVVLSNSQEQILIPTKTFSTFLKKLSKLSAWVTDEFSTL